MPKANRGVKTGTGAKANKRIDTGSFSPTKSDDTTDKLQGKTLSLSANTVTIKGENGKTQGMVRNISRVSTSSPQDQMMLHSFSKASGVDVRHFGTENIYKSDGKIYIFNNTKADHIYVKLKDVNKAEFDKFVERKKKLSEAEKAGAYIINYTKY